MIVLISDVMTDTHLASSLQSQQMGSSCMRLQHLHLLILLLEFNYVRS